MIKNKQELRKSVLERDNFTCQQCGNKENLECHHIKPQCDFPELALDIDNCITLCHECHTKTDSYKVYRHRTKKSDGLIKVSVRITPEMKDYISTLSRFLRISENDTIKMMFFEYMNNHKRTEK